MTRPFELPSSVRGYLRPRFVIGAAVTALVLALLLNGLLTPAPTHPVSAHVTPGPAAPLVGHFAPNITVVDLSGNRITLASLRGKVVALNFWYAACEPCKIEMPALQHSYDQYKSQGFVVLGVDSADNGASASAFVREVGITYPVVLDQSLATYNAYDVAVTPSTYFIDRNGVIQAKVAGALDTATLKTNVTALLSAPVAQARPAAW